MVLTTGEKQKSATGKTAAGGESHTWLVLTGVQ